MRHNSAQREMVTRKRYGSTPPHRHHTGEEEEKSKQGVCHSSSSPVSFFFSGPTDGHVSSSLFRSRGAPSALSAAVVPGGRTILHSTAYCTDKPIHHRSTAETKNVHCCAHQKRDVRHRGEWRGRVGWEALVVEGKGEEEGEDA